MRAANPGELAERAEPVLSAMLSESELDRLIPIEFRDINDPDAAAEPSKGALIQLAAGPLVVVFYGKESGRLVVESPVSADASRNVRLFLEEIAIPPSKIVWKRPDLAGTTGKRVKKATSAKVKFERLMPYHRRVVTYFMAFGFSRDEARDLTQDVYLHVYQRMDEHPGDAQWNYLQQVAHRQALNAFRDRQAQKRSGITVPEEMLVSMPDERNPPADHALAQRETWKLLDRAITQLESGLQRCMRAYMDGLSYDEIGRSLGLTASAVKSRLNLARKRLREMLSDDLEGVA